LQEALDLSFDRLLMMIMMMILLRNTTQACFNSVLCKVQLKILFLVS